MVSSSRLQDADDGVSAVEPSYDYPPDEFDVEDWAGPVGAHRAARKGWLVALPWLAVAAAVLLITGLALAFGLGRNGSDDSAAAPTSAASSGGGAAGASTSSATGSPSASSTGSASPSSSGSSSAAAGAVNRSTRIQILNSTRRNGLAHVLQNRMRGDGWNVTAVSTYRAAVLPSVVYFRNEQDRATAQAVAKLYGLGTKQSSNFNAPVTLMIGPGFPSP